jgi:phosphoribosylanthranilate isomerase
VKGAPPAVKICGLCRPEDAEQAAVAGADYLGVILSPGGPRHRTAEQAAAIFEAGDEVGHEAGRAVARAGVFVDGEPERVMDLARQLRLSVIQLHGSEPPDVTARVREAGSWQVWKAIRPRTADEFLAGVACYAGVATAVLLDGWSERAPGGTGERFPWLAVTEALATLSVRPHLVLAGGLTADNVAGAIRLMAPVVVDVSSGVEAEVGRKSVPAMRAFIAAVKETA